MSILSSKAGVISRHADFLQYKPLENNTDVLGNQPPGSVTISQMHNGFYEPNVQSAINDIHSFATLGLNSVLINTDGISPSGQPQTDSWEFTGTVTGEIGSKKGDDVIVTIYGISINAKVGDNNEEFTRKAKLALEDLISSHKAIKRVVEDPVSGSILQITYSDNQVHDLPSMTSKGITVARTVLSPSKPGYGDWQRIGAQSITFDGANSPTILYYFKRIA